MGNKTKIQTIELSMQEIWMHTRRQVVKSKKTYNRKPKHKSIRYDGI